jgi:perosamine synthetase
VVRMNALHGLKRRLADPLLNLVCNSLMISTRGKKHRAPFGGEELKLLYLALRSQNLGCTTGTMVRALEREFAVAYGVPYAVASTSGTAAIHVALGALDLNPGDEVITAPITDLGSVIPILYQNAIPVFADIDESYNMDPRSVEQRITARTRAIVVVHLFGNPCDMDAMMEVARRHNIPLIEDCSQTHMTKYKGQYVGTIGDIGCFSFQQSKQMTTGDGGMTITGNKKYFERMSLFADKGYARKGWGARAYLFHAPNYRMTELVGAVGLAQLKKVRAVVEKRSELGRYLSELLAGVPSVTPAPVTPGAEHAYWLYPLRVKGIDVDVLAKEMRKEKIPAVPGYTGKPIYLCSESLTAKKTYGDSQCPFTCQHTTSTYEYKEGLCPRAEATLEQLICIPWDESWTPGDVEKVAYVVARSVEKLSPSNVPVGSPQSGSRHSSAPSPIAKTRHSRSVRIGIVGCGQIGRWHLDSYKKDPRCEVVAFADTDFARAQKFAEEVGANAYRSHQEMIEKEALHGVSVCSVPSTHRDIALDLFEAGINVLCEKPLAISVLQAQEMYEKAKEKKLLLLTAFKFRFHDEVVKAKELIAKGNLGKILNFRLMFGGYLDMAGSWYARREFSGGGVVMDNGPHAVDLIQHLVGDIESVSAEVGHHQGIEVEDTAELIVRSKDGTVGFVDLSWSIPVPSKTYLEIYGEDGAMQLDSQGISYKLKAWKDWRTIPNQCSVRDAFSRQVAYFVDAITGKEATVLGNEEGLKAQIVIEALYESVKRGGRVSVAR